MQPTIKRRIDALEQLAERRSNLQPFWYAPEWQTLIQILREELTPEQRGRIAGRLLEAGL